MADSSSAAAKQVGGRQPTSVFALDVGRLCQHSAVGECVVLVAAYETELFGARLGSSRSSGHPGRNVCKPPVRNREGLHEYMARWRCCENSVESPCTRTESCFATNCPGQ